MHTDQRNTIIPNVVGIFKIMLSRRAAEKSSKMNRLIRQVVHELNLELNIP